MSGMESIQRDGVGSQLGVSVFCTPVSSIHPGLPDLCANSSVYKITDETLPPGIFDDTMDPSIISNVPGTPLDFSHHLDTKTLKTNQGDVVLGSSSQTKTVCSSWLCTPAQNSVNFSLSITSPENDNEDMANLTETIPLGNTLNVSSRLPESENCKEKFNMKVESKNSTFDMSKSLEKGTSNSAAFPAVTTDSNTTFESQEHKENIAPPPLNSTVSTDKGCLEVMQEQHLNSTVDICGLSNTSQAQKPKEKLDCTVDISQLNVPKQDMCNERLASSKHCEKNGTFTKSSEESSASVDATVDLGQYVSESPHVSPAVGEPDSASMQSAFSKHNLTTDLTPPEPNSVFRNSTVNMTKTSNTELPTQSIADVGVVNDVPLFKLPGSAGKDVAITVSSEAAVCPSRTLNLHETENKGEEPQELYRRRNGISDGECPNLDISQSSLFSLDDTLDIKSRALVTSTPIVLGRGFDRLRVAKPTDMQHRLSVINSIDAQSNDDLVGVSENDAVDASEPTPSSVKSETCRQTQKDATKCTLNSTKSEVAVVNKPPSKLAVRRKIPQPFCKSNIPKTQLPPRPSTSQGTLLAVKSRTVPAAQTLNQVETTSSTLNSLKRNVQLKGKNAGPAKNAMTVGTVRTASLTTSTSVCSSAVDLKPSSACLTQPKPSGLQPPGRGRFGLKPPGSVIFSAESSQSQTNGKATGMRTRSSLLPGFAQKHASSEALPLAKRKKTDMHDQLVRADAVANSKLGGNVQRPITAAKGTQPEKTNAACENCTVLQDKLHKFHQDLGGFLQELEKMHTECENWEAFQQKFESCLEKFKSLQAEHQ